MIERYGSWEDPRDLSSCLSVRVRVDHDHERYAVLLKVGKLLVMNQAVKNIRAWNIISTICLKIAPLKTPNTSLDYCII